MAPFFLKFHITPADPEPHSIAASKEALVSLVNMSQDSSAAEKMLAMKVVGRVMDYIREGSCPHPRLMASVFLHLG